MRPENCNCCLCWNTYNKDGEVSESCCLIILILLYVDLCMFLIIQSMLSEHYYYFHVIIYFNLNGSFFKYLITLHGIILPGVIYAFSFA